jgi:UrcA family protein
MNRKNLLTTVAALLLCSAAQGVFATDSEYPSMKVRFGDLNLQTEEGARVLYHRIQGAARLVCNDAIPAGGLGRASQLWKCIDTAVANAVNQVNNTKLTAMYQEKSNHKGVG